jgi:hypothetical protein
MSQKTFLLLLAVLALPVSLSAVDIGVGVSYGPALMGFGTKVGDASSYLDRTNAKSKLTKGYTLGGELLLRSVQAETNIAVISVVGLYDLRYGFESYSRTYTNFPANSSWDKELAGKTDVYDVHAMHNRLQAGARFDFKTRLPFYLQLAAGAMIYNPVHLTLHRYTGDRHDVGIGNPDYSLTINSSKFFLSLNNSSEAMFVGTLRLGMGFIYSELEVVTNGRVTAVNLMLGLDVLRADGGKLWL